MSSDCRPAAEREALAAFLDVQRNALVRKVQGVTDADARRAPTASSLSLLSVLKHSTLWEERWFQGVVAGLPLADGWPDQQSDPIDADFRLGEQDTVDEWLVRYRDAADVSRGIVAARGLDAACARPDVLECNVRWVLLHLIEETARHAGHADILRETIDGSRGL